MYIRKGVVLQEVTNRSWLSSTHFPAQQATRCSYVAKEMMCRSNLQVTMTNTIHKLVDCVMLYCNQMMY